MLKGQMNLPIIDEEITLTDLRGANVSRQREWDPTGKITPDFFALELAGEVGELLNVYKKLMRHKLELPGSRATREDLENELADVLIVLDLFAMRMDVDLTTALKRKFNATSDKLKLSTKL